MLSRLAPAVSRARPLALSVMPRAVPFIAAVPSGRMASQRMMSTKFSLPTIPSWLNLKTLKAYSPQIAGVGAAVVVIYGLSTTMVYVTSSILSLDLYDAFYMGFWTGISSAAILALGGVYFWRLASLSPRFALRRALSRVQSSTQAREALGANIKLGDLKAYTVYNGHLSLSKRLAWVEPRAQLLFHVLGDSGEGMVSAEAVNHKGKVVFNVIAVDTLAKAGKASQLLVLAGSEQKLHVKGQLRGFLQTERATFIRQDQWEDDDARVSEQEKLPSDESEETTSTVTAAANSNTPSPLR